MPPVRLRYLSCRSLIRVWRTATRRPTAAWIAIPAADAAELGIEVVSLPPWYDVDDASSLRRLAIELFGDNSAHDGRGGSDAPFTRDFLRGLIADGLAARLDLDDLLDIKTSG